MAFRKKTKAAPEYSARVIPFGPPADREAESAVLVIAHHERASAQITLAPDGRGGLIVSVHHLDTFDEEDGSQCNVSVDVDGYEVYWQKNEKVLRSPHPLHGSID